MTSPSYFLLPLLFVCMFVCCLFFSALGHDYENKLSVRLWQVRNEIETRGHYNLTYEELVFGARTAWRNAPRCVNRIVWRQLEVCLFS